MPDLNSVPKSSHALARESSEQMPPPPLPTSPSLNILPSNQSTVNQGATGSPSPLPSPHFAPSTIPAGPILADLSMSSPASGPVRHPRPYTAADIHQELEKEQEGIVCLVAPGNFLLELVYPQVTDMLLFAGQPPYPRAFHSPYLSECFNSI
jgi:hypothetical protein